MASRSLAAAVWSRKAPAEKLIEFLRTFETRETSYAGAYLDLIYHLRRSAENDRDLDRPLQDYLRLMTVGMAVWHGVVSEILDPGPARAVSARFEEDALVGNPW